MKDELIESIMQQMLPYLDNAQMESKRKIKECIEKARKL